MSIAIKISDKEHGKVRFATTVVVTGKAGADEVYVGYNDALLRLSVDKETMDKLRVGEPGTRRYCGKSQTQSWCRYTCEVPPSDVSDVTSFPSTLI